MPTFGRRSASRLATCHEDIERVCLSVIQHYDFTVIWGFRDEAAQNEAYAVGNSTKRWPHSKHNHRLVLPGNGVQPISLAVDLAPWFPDKPHVRWDNEREFIYLAGHMMQAAAELGIGLRWGGDWDSDHDLYDKNRPFDLGHFELTGG